MLEVENRDTIMKKEKDNSKPIERKKYIPPANHPWRKKLVTKHWYEPRFLNTENEVFTWDKITNY